MLAVLLLWLAILPMCRTSDLDDVLSQISVLQKSIVVNTTDQIDAQQMDIIALLATVKHAVNRMDKLEQALSGASEQIGTLTGQLNSTQERVGSLEGGMVSVIQQLGDINVLVGNVAESIGTFTAQLNVMDDKVAGVEQEINNTTERVEGMSESLDGISGNVKTLQQEVAKTGNHVASLSAGLNKVIDNVSSLKQDMNQTVKVGKDDKISSSVLPGSYSSHSLEDVQWQSLHMAAAASCIGYPTRSGEKSDSEHWSKTRAVIPAQYGQSCYSTCKETWYKSCAGMVVLGGTDRRIRDRREAGHYITERCWDRPSRDQTESHWRDEDILKSKESCPSCDKMESVAYCCCAKEY